MAEGSHPFPFRTRKLSPPAPMVLGERSPGRVGRRRISQRRPPPRRGSFSFSGGLARVRWWPDRTTIETAPSGRRVLLGRGGRPSGPGSRRGPVLVGRAGPAPVGRRVDRGREDGRSGPSGGGRSPRSVGPGGPRRPPRPESGSRLPARPGPQGWGGVARRGAGRMGDDLGDRGRPGPAVGSPGPAIERSRWRPRSCSGDRPGEGRPGRERSGRSATRSGAVVGRARRMRRRCRSGRAVGRAGSASSRPRRSPGAAPDVGARRRASPPSGDGATTGAPA